MKLMQIQIAEERSANHNISGTRSFLNPTITIQLMPDHK